MVTVFVFPTLHPPEDRLFQCGTQSQIENGSADNSDHRIDGSGELGNFQQGFGNVLGNTEKVGFIQITDQRIGNYIKSHAAYGSKYRNPDNFPLTGAFNKMENLVGDQTDNETDAEL